MTRLALCPQCSRHVRATESACPFCSSSLDANELVVRAPLATRGLKRAALFALLGTVAASACGEEDDGTGSAQQMSSSSASASTSGDDTNPQAVYGAPVASSDGDDMNLQPLYGAPFPSSTQIDDGNNQAQPVYGGPPIMPEGEGGAGNVTPAGEGGSGGLEDPGPIAMPVYGAPVAPEATDLAE